MKQLAATGIGDKTFKASERATTRQRAVEAMQSETETDVFSDALSLPTSDRARLAHEPSQSLDESEDPDAPEAWLTEIERRAREVKAGTARSRTGALFGIASQIAGASGRREGRPSRGSRGRPRSGRRTFGRKL